AAAWTRARTMSSAMFNLKVLSSLQQASPLGMLGAGSLHGPSPLSGSSSSVTPPGNPRSVLHPDNQRALARQGFYGDNLPEGVDPDIVHGAQRGNDEDDVPTRRSAEDRRKMYHKTRSKRQRSLVESNGDESGPAETISRDSVMKSVDFSTTTESTDSGELLSSAPTTPGDVFTDRATSPLPGAPANIEDLYFPGRDEIHSKFSDSRKKLTEKLMADLDNDDNYFVSPPGSRQPTVEKAATLTEAQEQNLEEEVDEMELPAARAASVKSDLSTKSVTIVVSGNSGARKASPINLPGVGGMNFLSIVNAAVDRLSDSGSEHTLVEHQSSTSGSESPRPSQTGSNGEQKQNQGGDESHCDGFADVEEGPVLYHGRRRGQGSPRDENDNFTEARQAQGEKLRHHRVKSQFLDDELPRMSSIQSDSSGFGDAEVSGDNAPQEMAFLKVNSLGSSCESSTTQGSTSTVTHVNNIPGQQRDSSTHSSPFYLHAEFDDNQQVQSRVTHKQGSGPSPTDPGSGRRFVSWCYIPVSNRSTQPNSTSPRKQSTRAATSPKDFVLGKTRISLVLQEKDPQQMDSSGRRDVRREGAELDSNERPLSEELALAGLRGELQSSTPRYPAGQVPVTSVPRLMLQRPTMDTGSPDGTRSSGDELDDERSSPYSPWGRDMASGGAGARHRFTPSAGDEGDFGSGASVEESSVYSCASTTDSITSGSSSEILDCHKLIKLINQPTMFKGRKTRVVHYRPKRHLREWPSLVKKKKLQEETRLAQYAVQKFKTELSIMETAVMVKYQMAFEDLSQEEREDVEELQHLWSEVRRQVMETEHLLTSRMKAIASGNDCFNSLASISVLQRVNIHLLTLLRDFEFSWGELPRSPAVRGHYSSSFSHLPMSPAYPDRTFEQLRRSLMSDVRQELGTSLQSLQDDLQRRDEEIQRLQQQLMEQRTRGSRPSSSRSRSYQSPRQRNVNRKETDV
ncbi:hypothetical protein BaRGS_00007518, partial [Batillaria attramentaria]